MMISEHDMNTADIPSGAPENQSLGQDTSSLTIKEAVLKVLSEESHPRSACCNEFTSSRKIFERINQNVC